MTLATIGEAQASGARLHKACEMAGISARTIERWRGYPDADDARRGPQRRPGNALSPLEQARIVALMTSAEYRHLPPKQLVPRLADEGIYLASESTMYRLLRRCEPCGRLPMPTRSHVTRATTVHCATEPNQVWSWDITYLPTPVRGRFLRLYLVLDVWSRRIVGWKIHERESDELAAEMIRDICDEAKIDANGLVLHSDNGKPMRGSTMIATLQWLGIVPSFSRPHVSDDNPTPRRSSGRSSTVRRIRDSPSTTSVQRDAGPLASSLGTMASTATARFAATPPTNGTSAAERRSTPHRALPVHRAAHPVHVTLRSKVRPLRSQRLFSTLCIAIGQTNRRDKARFRVLHFSIQYDHVHVIVEATDKGALSSGVRSLAIGIALAVNRLLGRRGRLWADRWFGRALASPRQVRNALVYVLANFRKHARHAFGAGVDRFSSGAWFDGWRRPDRAGVGAMPAVGPPRRAAQFECPVSRARTWLGGVGWRRRGLIGFDEAPV